MCSCAIFASCSRGRVNVWVTADACAYQPEHLDECVCVLLSVVSAPRARGVCWCCVVCAYGIGIGDDFGSPRRRPIVVVPAVPPEYGSCCSFRPRGYVLYPSGVCLGSAKSGHCDNRRLKTTH